MWLDRVWGRFDKKNVNLFWFNAIIYVCLIRFSPFGESRTKNLIGCFHYYYTAYYTTYFIIIYHVVYYPTLYFYCIGIVNKYQQTINNLQILTTRENTENWMI